MASNPKSNRTALIAVLVGVIIAALVVALFTGGSDDSDSSGATSTAAAIDGAPGENQAVVVIGNPLDAFVSVRDDSAVGSMAPGLEGLSFDGSAVSVTPGDGRAYMVVFLAHWCPHCNAEIPRLIEWKEAGRVPEGLQVVGISTSVASDRPNFPPSKWSKDKQWPWPIMADSAAFEAAQAYGVTGFPFFAVVGEDGLIKIRVSGEVEPDVLDEILSSVLNS